MRDLTLAEAQSPSSGRPRHSALIETLRQVLAADWFRQEAPLILDCSHYSLLCLFYFVLVQPDMRLPGGGEARHQGRCHGPRHPGRSKSKASDVYVSTRISWGPSRKHPRKEDNLTQMRTFASCLAAVQENHVQPTYHARRSHRVD